MAALVLIFMFSLTLLLPSALGNGEGWNNAHATFYGGGDAPGTMGMSQTLALFVLHIKLFFFLIFFLA